MLRQVRERERSKLAVQRSLERRGLLSKGGGGGGADDDAEDMKLQMVRQATRRGGTWCTPPS